MKFAFSALALFAAALTGSADAACGPNALVANKAGSGAQACICPSWSQDDTGSGTCSALTTANGQPLSIAACPPTSTDVAGSNLVDLALMGVTATMNGASSDVNLNLTMPAMAGRNFTAVGFTGIGDPDFPFNCQAEFMFKSFKANTNGQTQCVDKWEVVADFFEMVRCGMTYNAAATTPQYQAYDVNWRIKYEELVSIGGDSAYASIRPRNVTADYPVRIFFQRQYSAALSSNAKVFSDYTVDFTIVSQNIPKVNVSQSGEAGTTGNASMYFEYTIQYPYAITSFDEVIKGTPNNTQDSPFTPKINGQDGSTNLTGTDLCSTANNPDVPDYSALAQGATNGAAATCKKGGNYIEYTGLGNGTKACRFGSDTSAYVYSLFFSVGCGAGIAAIDCPLGLQYQAGSNQRNYVSFNVRSENFCVGLSVQTIDNVITITNFTAVSVFDYETPQAGWRYGDNMFLRMDFTGLPVIGCKLVALRRKWATEDLSNADLAAISTTDKSQGQAIWQAADLGVTLASWLSDRGAIPTQFNNAPDTNPALAGKSLGLQASGQSFWFTTILGTDFLDFDTTSTTDSAILKRGEQRFLKLYATIQVTYPSVAPGRRRRRQAAGGVSQGEGSIASSTQTLEANEPQAAIAPNSNGAARAFAPAVAVVLALLSAVALL